MSAFAVRKRLVVFVAVGSVLGLTACGKKDPEPAAAASAPAPEAPARTEGAPAEARQSAIAAAQAVQKEATVAAAKVEEVLQTAESNAKVGLQAAAGAVKIAEGEKAAAKAETGMAEAAAKMDAAKAEAAKQAASLQEQAASMFSKYSGELETLTSGVASIKKLVDQNANLLPAEYQASYRELNAMLPRLGSLVSSLKGYQGTDLSGIVGKLQTDFGAARKLYDEIKGKIPTGLTAPKIGG